MSSSLQFSESFDSQDVENSPNSPVHTHCIESFDSVSTPICTLQRKQPFRKTLSDPFTAIQRNHTPVYKVKSCDCASFDRPKSLYQELMEAKVRKPVCTRSNSYSCRKISQIKRKRLETCHSSKNRFSFVPHINFKQLSFKDNENPQKCTFCQSNSSRCFSPSTSNFLIRDTIKEVPCTKSSFAKCDTNKAQDQRKSHPLVTRPVKTNDFFPSRSKLVNSENFSSSDVNSVPLQNSISNANGFGVDCKTSSNPFRSRLHRLQCISDSYSTFFNESFGMDDDVFSPKSPLCSKCFCSPSVENKLFDEKILFQENGETNPLRIHHADIASSPNNDTTVNNFNNFASSPNKIDSIVNHSANFALPPNKTKTAVMHCNFASPNKTVNSLIHCNNFTASNKTGTTVMHSDEIAISPNANGTTVTHNDNFTSPLNKTGTTVAPTHNNTSSIWKNNGDEGIKTSSKNKLLVSNSFPFIDKIKSNEVPDAKSMNSYEKKTLITAQNKREAMQEKKIHIFSKFLANLNKLSASNMNFSTAGNSNPIGEKSNDAFSLEHCLPISDKQEQSNSSRKCHTPPPEFDKFYLSHSNNNVKRDSSSQQASISCKLLPECIYRNEVCFNVNGASEYCPKPFYSCSLYFPMNSENGKFPNSSGEESSDRNCSQNAMLSKNKVPFKGVSKDLEELQASIQKAKETRISASRELNFLQELLSGEVSEEQQNSLSSKHIRSRNEKDPSLPRSFSSDVIYRGMDNAEKPKALSDLREKSKRQVLEDTDFWQEELEKVKKESEQTWKDRLQRMEEKLRSQESELMRIQSENEEMQRRLQERSSPCQCKSDPAQNGFLRIDSAFEDDDEFFNLNKPSSPTLTMKQEMDRLQDKLAISEQRSDELNLLLNQKLIELNKLQITLSKQTKEMIELEKSYLQLQFRYRKNATKPIISRLCSKSSPFSSKNLFPKPSPPATPVPGICP